MFYIFKYQKKISSRCFELERLDRSSTSTEYSGVGTALDQFSNFYLISYDTVTVVMTAF